jgi:hypothetical protein
MDSEFFTGNNTLLNIPQTKGEGPNKNPQINNNNNNNNSIIIIIIIIIII